MEKYLKKNRYISVWYIYRDISLVITESLCCIPEANTTSSIKYVHASVHPKSLWLSLTLCDPVDCNPPGSSVHEFLQAKILEWVTMPSSRGFLDPEIEPTSPALADRFFTTSTNWGTCKSTMCLVAQSCPSLCDPVDYSPPGSSVYGDSSGKNTGVSCLALLKERKKEVTTSPSRRN